MSTAARAAAAIELRLVSPAEFPAWFMQAQHAFGTHYSDDAAQRWSQIMEGDDAVGAWDGDTLVGTAIALPTKLTMSPNVALSCAGVSLVTVAPTHRRRGLLRRMMEWLTDLAVQRGDAVAALYASEGTIYSRFGFGAAAPSIRISLPYSGMVLGDDRAGEGVRLLTREQASQVLPALHERLTGLVAGNVNLPQVYWRRLSWPPTEQGHQQIAVLGPPGEERGYATYRATTKWNELAPAAPDGTLEVDYLLGTDAGSELELWQYLFNIDLVRHLTARLRPSDDVLLQALRDPLLAEVRADEPLWLRVLDPASAFGARTYGCDGQLTIDLADPHMLANTGTWTLEVSGGTGSMSQTSQQPDLAMSASELAAVCLGGTKVRDLCRAGRIEQRTEGAASRADRILENWPQPWNGTHF